MNTSVIIGTTKNGQKVYLDEKSTHAHTHFVDNPDLLGFVREALKQIDATDDEVFVDVDLGRPIGKTDLVETNDNDDIFYAKRLNRGDIYTRFVKNRERAETSFTTVVLVKISDGYRLSSAWFGRKSLPFPNDNPKYEMESREFWKNHALVWGKQEIQQGTETAECPWK